VINCDECCNRNRLQTVQAVWEQQKREEEEAAEAYKLRQKVVSLEEVRERLRKTLETAEEQDIERPVYFTFNRFSQPVYLEELGLSSKGVYAAAGGAEFKRITLSEKGIPIEIELVRFGEQTSIHVRVLQGEIKEGLISIFFLDNQVKLFACLVPISNGTGKRILEESDISILGQLPETVQINTRLVSLPLELSQAVAVVLVDVKESLELLRPLIAHPSPQIRRFAVALVGLVCDESALDLFESVMRDQEESVRQIASQIVNTLSHG